MVFLSKKHTQNCKFVHGRSEALLQLPKKCRIAEVGVLAGDLSEWILKNMDPSELHLIDVFYCDDFPDHNRFKKKDNYRFVENRFVSSIKGGKVFLRKGKSWDMLANYDDEYFDIIYIDAAHDYDSVKKDLAQSHKKIKPDGYIVMNDYIFYDHLAGFKYGVVPATNEFCVEHNWEFLYFAYHPNLFCDVVLRKIT